MKVFLAVFLLSASLAFSEAACGWTGCLPFWGGRSMCPNGQVPLQERHSCPISTGGVDFYCCEPKGCYQTLCLYIDPSPCLPNYTITSKVGCTLYNHLGNLAGMKYTCCPP
ncbi:hypothetical protein QR680_014532 [Steinernema hermaphroditum]|uniref:Uncharacterized protein n=1 Tax=Steinernema hermaphroditum TaxID=289476 RepID=A0AA39IAT7_9BILA|nr:hypothetical protein QR680_014532 [Steinernema hermaphroditum]